MPLDRARAEEQLSADLRVGVPVDRKPGDPDLLRGKVGGCLRSAPSDCLAGGQQLGAGAFIAASIWWAARSCSRASTRRLSRRSYSPYSR